MTREVNSTRDGVALRAVADRLASASVESGVGLEPVELAPGRVRFHVPLVAGARSPEGRVDPITLSVIADTTVGVAVFSAEQKESAGVTAELCVDHAGPLGDRACGLDVVAETLGAGPGVGTGRAEIRDDTGVVVAHAVGVVAVDPVPAARPAAERAVPRGFDPAEVRVVPVGRDSARVEIHPEMLNRRGTVHGGVLLGLAHEAQELYQLGLSARCRPLQVSIDYLRPAQARGHLELRSSLVRKGRGLWIVRTTIHDSDDRTVAIAHGTCVVDAATPVKEPSEAVVEMAE